MAGAVATGYRPGGAPAGMVWDPTRGGYVAPSVIQRDEAQAAEASRPKYTTSPLGAVSQYNTTTKAWDTIGNVNTAGAGGGSTGTSRAAAPQASAQDAQRQAAMQGLINQLQASPGDTYQPAQIAPIVTSGATGGSPYDLAGENAAYGAAKERTGLAMRAAMRGLRSQMAQRGLVGSGIDADKLEELYMGGLSELGATDRQLAEQRAGRAFTAGQSDTDRTISQNTYNVGAQNTAAQFNADAARQRMELIARLTQAMY